MPVTCVWPLRPKPEVQGRPAGGLAGAFRPAMRAGRWAGTPPAPGGAGRP